MATIVNPVLPDILTNGTIADATQVMANFASIISQVNANAAENGANTSITSLTGLTTPLGEAYGGTGVDISTFTQFELLVTSTGGLGTVTNGAAGTVLVSNGTGSIPTFQGISAALSNAQLLAILGFTPVQQGTGINQGTNVVKLGWSTVSGNGLGLTIDATNEGFIPLSSTSPAAGYTFVNGANFTGGLQVNGSPVWNSGNLQPLNYNTIGSVQVFLGTNVTPNTTFAAPAGFSGTWLSQSVFNTTGGGSGFCTLAVRVS